MTKLSTSNDHGRSGVWFGGLLSPEAYLIATQQSTAQQHEWSLEELDLQFDFDPSEEEIQQAVDERSGFIVHGLSVESAEYDRKDASLKLTNRLSATLPTINLRWVHKDASRHRAQPTASGGAGADQPPDFVELPVYLNRSRKHLLCSVRMPTFGIKQHTWYQRGVALFASTV